MSGDAPEGANLTGLTPEQVTSVFNAGQKERELQSQSALDFQKVLQGSESARTEYQKAVNKQKFDMLKHGLEKDKLTSLDNYRKGTVDIAEIGNTIKQQKLQWDKKKNEFTALGDFASATKAAAQASEINNKLETIKSIKPGVSYEDLTPPQRSALGFSAPTTGAQTPQYMKNAPFKAQQELKKLVRTKPNTLGETKPIDSDKIDLQAIKALKASYAEMGVNIEEISMPGTKVGWNKKKRKIWITSKINGKITARDIYDSLTTTYGYKTKQAMDVIKKLVQQEQGDGK